MNRSLYEFDEDIGYRFIPNLKARVPADGGGYLLKANAQGFRNNEDFEIEKKGKRLLVFGDSFTAGDGVSNGKRYTDFLQKDSDFEVYNFGLSGTGTDQQYLIYRKFAKDIDCDAYILTILVENIRRVNAKFRFYYDENENMICYPKPYYIMDGESLILKHSPVPNTTFEYEELSESDKLKVDTGGRFMGARKLLNKLGLKQLVQKNLKIQPFPEYSNSENKEWKLMKGIILKWIKELDKPVYILPLPTYHYIEDLAKPNDYIERFKELEKETNSKILDPLPYFRSFNMELRRKFRFEKDIHLTELGHKTLADFIAKEIN